MSELEHELKEFIIRTLVLEECTPEDIDSEEPLFGHGLGLDSVDALELGMALQKQYGVMIDTESEETKLYFANVRSLARFVEERRKSAEPFREGG